MVRTVPGRTERIVVVGAGLAGLAAALRLRGAGREVTVVERAQGPGGRAGRVERNGYALDTGPSVFTAPEILADTLAAVGEKLEERLTLVPL
jgi:phytoene desaturase